MTNKEYTILYDEIVIETIREVVTTNDKELITLFQSLLTNPDFKNSGDVRESQQLLANYLMSLPEDKQLMLSNEINFSMLHQIHRIISYKIFTNKKVGNIKSDKEKIEALDEGKEKLMNLSYLNPTVDKAVYLSPELEFLENKRKKIIVPADKQQQPKRLFNIDESKLQSLLINENLITKGEYKMESVLTINWIVNTNRINWIGKQYAILYLFYLINNNNREMINGTITKMISHLFTIDGEIIEERNLTKSMSAMLKTYIDKGKHKPAFLLQIERIFNDSK